MIRNDYYFRAEEISYDKPRMLPTYRELTIRDPYIGGVNANVDYAIPERERYRF